MSWIPEAAVDQDYVPRIHERTGFVSRSGSLARARLNSRIEICHVYRSAVTNLVASVQHRSLLSNPEPYSSSSCEVSSLG